MIACFACLTVALPGLGQSFRVLHAFTGPEGRSPEGVLTLDQTGNLYGTTYYGGSVNGNCRNGCGTVFELIHRGSNWSIDNVHKFSARGEGAFPTAGVVFGPDGALYGTTSLAVLTGPNNQDAGTVYKLVPSVCGTALCPWRYTVIHRFFSFAEGDNPTNGNVVFDHGGNLYGTLQYGGPACIGDPCGLVYELTPDGDSWLEKTIYSFTGGSDGNWPIAGVVFDSLGNLYGETEYGGMGDQGNAYELIPSPSGWTESTIYSFGPYPGGGLMIDRADNLYGTVCCDGAVFELNFLNGDWMLNVLYSFGGPGYLTQAGPLVMDGDGNLYGTTTNGGTGGGNVYKLSPTAMGWIYTDIHDFHGPDGATPFSGVTLDASGNIFGTTAFGGDVTGCNPPAGCGVVWEIAKD